MSSAVYLYCLVRSRKPPALTRAPRGLPGTGRPRLLDAGGSLWVVACDAPQEHYGRDVIHAGLRDLGWVSACALAHEAVVEHAAKAGPVVPMKLFTLFTSDDRALAYVKRVRRSLERVFDRVAGRVEWGVRLTLDEARARAGSPRARRPAAGAGSGTRFLLRKQTEREALRQARLRGRADADRLFRAIAAHADDARRRPPPAGVPGGPQLLLDAAFLVPAGNAARFRAAVRRAVRRLGGAGYDAVLSGPWPPYHFVGWRR